MSQTLKGKGAAWVQAPDPRGALLSTGHTWILAWLKVWDTAQTKQMRWTAPCSYACSEHLSLENPKGSQSSTG